MKPRTVVALLAIVVIALLAVGTQLLPAPHTIVLVRHAERADPSPDTALSADGQARAAHLADVLDGLAVRAIYVTEYQRTAQTAQPIAQRLGLTPVVVGAADSAGLLKKLRQTPDTILVIGHSDTVPALIKALGVSAPAAIQPDEFYHLDLVVTHPFGPPTLLRLRY